MPRTARISATRGLYTAAHCAAHESTKLSLHPRERTFLSPPRMTDRGAARTFDPPRAAAPEGAIDSDESVGPASRSDELVARAAGSAAAPESRGTALAGLADPLQKATFRMPLLTRGDA